jgi:major membrane immunogen (membrane-anchored lipoprotein)
MSPSQKHMKHLFWVLFLLALLLMTGCGSWDFNPYDYKNHKDAKVKNEDANCEIKLKNRRPCIEWTWPLNK